MKNKIVCSLLTFACLFSFNINAAEETRQMTQEEYQMISQASAEHMYCMDESSIKQLETQTDIRVIADHAMKDCAPILEKLYNSLVEIDYAPEASGNIVSSISNKAANKVLSRLMMFMAGRGQ